MQKQETLEFLFDEECRHITVKLCGLRFVIGRILYHIKEQRWSFVVEIPSSSPFCGFYFDTLKEIAAFIEDLPILKTYADVGKYWRQFVPEEQ